MSLAVAIGAIVILDLALLAALAFVMSLPRQLTPHAEQVVQVPARKDARTHASAPASTRRGTRTLRPAAAHAQA